MLPRAAVQSQGQWTLVREPFETNLLRLGNQFLPSPLLFPHSLEWATHIASMSGER